MVVYYYCKIKYLHCSVAGCCSMVQLGIIIEFLLNENQTTKRYVSMCVLCNFYVYDCSSVCSLDMDKQHLVIYGNLNGCFSTMVLLFKQNIIELYRWIIISDYETQLIIISFYFIHLLSPSPPRAFYLIIVRWYVQMNPFKGTFSSGKFPFNF